MLQDMRHLLIIDLRSEEEFKASHIRRSVHATMEDYQQKLVENIAAGPKELIATHKSQFENDDMKRVLFVLPHASWKTLEAQINKELPVLNEELLLKAYSIRITKAYFTKDYKEISTKYPFVCVGGESS